MRELGVHMCLEIGKLNYFRTRGRLDIDYAVGKLARLVLCPPKNVIKAAEKLLKYIYNTRKLGVTLTKDIKGNKDITIATDASLGSKYDNKSGLGGEI